MRQDAIRILGHEVAATIRETFAAAGYNIDAGAADNRAIDLNTVDASLSGVVPLDVAQAIFTQAGEGNVAVPADYRNEAFA